MSALVLVALVGHDRWCGGLGAVTMRVSGLVNVGVALSALLPAVVVWAPGGVSAATEESVIVAEPPVSEPVEEASGAPPWRR
jgi:hypothetical protein